MTLKLRILRSLTRLFIMLVSLTWSLFCEKMLIFNRCICGLMSNLIKKSWTVSNLHPKNLKIDRNNPRFNTSLQSHFIVAARKQSVLYCLGYITLTSMQVIGTLWRTKKQKKTHFSRHLYFSSFLLKHKKCLCAPLSFLVDVKGHLISRCPFGVFKSSKKKHTKFFQDFCPNL